MPYGHFVLGSGARTGAPFQAAAIPVSSGTRAPSECSETHVNPSEDLVSKSSLQEQETETPAGRDNHYQQVPATTATSHRSARPGARWETESHGESPDN
jgi:hypothetical protein